MDLTQFHESLYMSFKIFILSRNCIEKEGKVSEAIKYRAC